jgi:hypothetical protein
MKKIICISVILIAALTACNKDKLSFDSVESGRAQANENSQFNASAWRQSHPEQ